ncbi:MAG: nucleoside 2-deoxyribosyltransferase [Promethearchaeota archaeon]
MKIIVVGSIGYGGFQELKEMIHFLREEGLDVIDQFAKEGLDYSEVDDFREKRGFSQEIVNFDLKMIEKADTVVLILNGPSFGAAFEVAKARELNKRIILFAPEKVPTPWPIAFSDEIVVTKNDLIKMLKDE